MAYITDMDRYLYGNGTHYEIYNKLGAHFTAEGVHFAVWAPHAVKVSLVGDFNSWNPESDMMQQVEESGIWEITEPNAKEWDMYKYCIYTKDDRQVYKADPYAFHSELRPGTASKIADIEGFKWEDRDYIDNQNKHETKKYHKAVSVYEVHLGSWKKDYSNSFDGFIDYRSIAPMLAQYVKEQGYTHIELMGIAEHPFDGSWGYQVTGYYSPTARYGGPKDFMYFVNYMHKEKIGVILDWVPAHFPMDEHGLSNFDGEPLYEYADSRKGIHKEWGTKVFDYSNKQVSNFMIANALYWVEKYHIDALRVDAVASMLYLDYGRKDGEWLANIYGDNKNLEAIEFFKHLGSIMNKRNPRAMLIAEESTAWPYVTAPSENGGLGFDLKWNMGWMNDFLEYVKLDPLFKKGAHNKMTFGLTYAFSERFMLVLSHDEVVHLKCSMYSKMPGFAEDKAKNLMTAYTFMIGHPGRKLIFMGQDFGQVKEWSESREVDWSLLEIKRHSIIKNYMSKLLHLYRDREVMHCYDDDYRCFEWINCDDCDRSIFSFIRKNPDNYKNALIFICNFTPVDRADYMVGVPKKGEYKLLMSNYEERNDEMYMASKAECDNREYSLSIHLHPMESMVIALK